MFLLDPVKQILSPGVINLLKNEAGKFHCQKQLTCHCQLNQYPQQWYVCWLMHIYKLLLGWKISKLPNCSLKPQNHFVKSAFRALINNMNLHSNLSKKKNKEHHIWKSHINTRGILFRRVVTLKQANLT